MKQLCINKTTVMEKFKVEIRFAIQVIIMTTVSLLIAYFMA